MFQIGAVCASRISAPSCLWEETGQILSFSHSVFGLFGRVIAISVNNEWLCLNQKWPNFQSENTVEKLLKSSIQMYIYLGFLRHTVH